MGDSVSFPLFVFEKDDCSMFLVVESPTARLRCRSQNRSGVILTPSVLMWTRRDLPQNQEKPD